MSDITSAEAALVQQSTGPCGAPGKPPQQMPGCQVSHHLQATESTASVQTQPLAGRKHKSGVLSEMDWRPCVPRVAVLYSQGSVNEPGPGSCFMHMSTRSIYVIYTQFIQCMDDERPPSLPKLNHVLATLVNAALPPCGKQAAVL